VILLQELFSSSPQPLLFSLINALRCAPKNVVAAIPDFNKYQILPVHHYQVNFAIPAMVVLFYQLKVPS
jgi:hypothetical protein